MPEMNGIEATRRIVSAHPDVVVFLCSTYDVEDLPPAPPTAARVAYVNKERFGAETLRQLWADRDSGSFAVPPERSAPSWPGSDHRYRSADR